MILPLSPGGSLAIASRRSQRPALDVAPVAIAGSGAS